MSEAQPQLPTLTRKVANILEKKFPELSEEHCLDRSGRFCELTNSRCALSKCPKMKKTVDAHM